MDEEGLENTHNDVCGDDDVEVRDPKTSEQGKHQPDTGEVATMKVDQKRIWKILVGAGATMALVAWMASTLPTAYAAGTIKSDDENKWISVGMGLKTQFSAVQNQAANGQTYSKEFGIPNALIYINGQIHKYVGFEFNTECFNCSVGGGGGSFGGNSSIGIADAIGKFEFNQYANLWVGRMLVTGERSELNGPFFHGLFDTFKMPFTPADFSANFGPGGAGLFNRDNGATFWGQVDPGVGHLQYSAGVFTGLRSTATAGPNQANSLMYAGRLTYNFLSPEKNPGYYTQGTYFGTAGDILAIAVGGQYQNSGAGSLANHSDFTSLATDLLFEKPLGNNMDMGVITFNAEYKRYWANYNAAAFGDGDCFCIFRGQSYTIYGMYLLPQEVGIGKFQPYGRYTYVNSVFTNALDEFELGTNYIISGHNARISTYWRTGNLSTNGGFLGASPLVGTGQHQDSFNVALQLQY